MITPLLTKIGKINKVHSQLILNLIGLVAFYQRNPMDLFDLLVKASIQLYFAICQTLFKLINSFLTNEPESTE